MGVTALFTEKMLDFRYKISTEFKTTTTNRVSQVESTLIKQDNGPKTIHSITDPAPGTYSRRGHKAESSDPALKEVWKIKLRA